jgi:hypothetical protein
LILIINHNPVPFAIKPDAFFGIDQSTCELKVPSTSVSEYKKAKVWKEFNIVGIEVK